MRDPKQYKDTAEEIRTCADGMKDEKCKQQLYSCAEMHERLAVYALQLQVKKKLRSA